MDEPRIPRHANEPNSSSGTLLKTSGSVNTPEHVSIPPRMAASRAVASAPTRQSFRFRDDPCRSRLQRSFESRSSDCHPRRRPRPCPSYPPPSRCSCRATCLAHVGVASAEVDRKSTSAAGKVRFGSKAWVQQTSPEGASSPPHQLQDHLVAILPHPHPRGRWRDLWPELPRTPVLRRARVRSLSAGHLARCTLLRGLFRPPQPYPAKLRPHLPPWCPPLPLGVARG